MRSFALSELLVPLQGTLPGVDASFDAVAIDSRSIQPGQLFVALQGDNFDGHHFLADVSERGASAAVVSAPASYPLPVLQVSDTRLALGRLGALNRQYFDGELIAITGSSGKTSVKNMVAEILAQRGVTLATAGNFNNEIGLPLTLLQLRPEHRFAVLEMGASAAGDISYLCELARPTVSVLLNALPAHLQGFGNLQGVARAKGEILSGLPVDGSAVFNADSDYAPLWRELAAATRSIEFGFSASASVTARDIELNATAGSQFLLITPQGEISISLSVPGRHNIANALAAAATALAIGLDLAEIGAGLASVTPAVGRMQSKTTRRGAVVIDDSYNANPGSVKAAIDVLASAGGRRLLVLGAMGELGAESEALHASVGRYACEQGLDGLWTVGVETAAAVAEFGAAARIFEDRTELIACLQRELGSTDVILVKGSRSAGMELVVSALIDEAGKED
jgi:UDP-N-acetylmuramoyl-tripeptide--D-alanyl-D-alanine ligase